MPINNSPWTESTTPHNYTATVTELSTIPEAPIDGTPYARQDADWVPATGGGIPEAPIDGTPYSRQDADWIAATGGGIPEAPIDGTPYSRQDADWISAIPEAPIDGTPYARQDADWIAATGEAPIDGTPYARQDADWISAIPEAPIDGTPYARQDADWIAAPAAITEAPIDGTPYARQDADWVSAFTVPITGTYPTLTFTRTGDSLNGRLASFATNNMYLTANAYFDGAWKRDDTSVSSTVLSVTTIGFSVRTAVAAAGNITWITPFNLVNGRVNIAGLTASRAVLTDADKYLVSSTITSAQLEALNGAITSSPLTVSGPCILGKATAGAGALQELTNVPIGAGTGTSLTIGGVTISNATDCVRTTGSTVGAWSKDFSFTDTSKSVLGGFGGFGNASGGEPTLTYLWIGPGYSDTTWATRFYPNGDVRIYGLTASRAVLTDASKNLVSLTPAAAPTAAAAAPSVAAGAYGWDTEAHRLTVTTAVSNLQTRMAEVIAALKAGKLMS